MTGVSNYVFLVMITAIKANRVSILSMQELMVASTSNSSGPTPQKAMGYDWTSFSPGEPEASFGCKGWVEYSCAGGIFTEKNEASTCEEHPAEFRDGYDVSPVTCEDGWRVHSYVMSPKQGDCQATISRIASQIRQDTPFLCEEETGSMAATKKEVETGYDWASFAPGEPEASFGCKEQVQFSCADGIMTEKEWEASNCQERPAEFRDGYDNSPTTCEDGWRVHSYVFHQEESDCWATIAMLRKKLRDDRPFPCEETGSMAATKIDAEAETGYDWTNVSPDEAEASFECQGRIKMSCKDGIMTQKAKEEFCVERPAAFHDGYDVSPTTCEDGWQIHSYVMPPQQGDCKAYISRYVKMWRESPNPPFPCEAVRFHFKE